MFCDDESYRESCKISNKLDCSLNPFEYPLRSTWRISQHHFMLLYAQNCCWNTWNFIRIKFPFRKAHSPGTESSINAIKCMLCSSRTLLLPLAYIPKREENKVSAKISGGWEAHRIDSKRHVEATTERSATFPCTMFLLYNYHEAASSRSGSWLVCVRRQQRARRNNSRACGWPKQKRQRHRAKIASS